MTFDLQICTSDVVPEPWLDRGIGNVYCRQFFS